VVTRYRISLEQQHYASTTINLRLAAVQRLKYDAADCGLRRAEWTMLRVEDIRQREEHRVIADLVGKGGHIRSIPVPDWVKVGIDAWMTASGIANGGLLRSINKAGRAWAVGFSPQVIWGVVKQKAKGCEIPAPAPHDLRKTCARLCHHACGELEQIQFLWGTSLCKQRSDTWVANRAFAAQSMIGLGSNRTRREPHRFQPLPTFED